MNPINLDTSKYMGDKDVKVTSLPMDEAKLEWDAAVQKGYDEEAKRKKKAEEKQKKAKQK